MTKLLLNLLNMYWAKQGLQKLKNITMKSASMVSPGILWPLRHRANVGRTQSYNIYQHCSASPGDILEYSITECHKFSVFCSSICLTKCILKLVCTLIIYRQ